MELWTSLRVLLRRWYVILPCLAITAFVAVQLAGQVKPTYKAEGTVVFLRPLQPPEATSNTNNPWQTVDYSLNQFALLMGQAAASDAFQERVASAGGSTTFSVTTSATQAQGSPTNQTPTLTLSVIADTPEAAMASYDVLGAALDQEVKDRQRSVGAAESTWITAVDLTVPPGAQELVGSRVTVLIAVTLAGTLASLGLVFALDAALVARRHRRDERADAASTRGSDGGSNGGSNGGSHGADPSDGSDASADDHERTPDGPVRLAPAPDPDPQRVDASSGAERPERRGVVDVDDLTLDDLIEDWPDEHPIGPRRPAIAGAVDGSDRDDGPDDVDEAVGQ